MSVLKISVCQHDIVWESPEENRCRIGSVLEKYVQNSAKEDYPDILLLPEFFATGFSMNTSLAETESGPTLSWMKDISRKYGFALGGSVPVSAGHGVFNRFYFLYPDGRAEHYDKRHLFRMSDENLAFTQGSSRKVLSFRGWRIGLNVCYDLRFPVWSRNHGDNAYDMMINVASWPKSRYEAAEILVRARAIENMSYYVFVNRTGHSPDTEYAGGSLVADFKGRLISATDTELDGFTFITAKADMEALLAFRKKFPAWKDADNYIILTDNE